MTTMSKKKKKYYTVWKGNKTGVFESWNDCKKQIKDFQGAQYKSFTTIEEAKKALEGNYFDYIGKNKSFKSGLTDAELKKIGLPNYNSISVDAASSGNPGIMEYRGVDTTDSRTAMSWVRKKTCNSKLKRSAKNKPVYDLVDRAVEWLKNNTYTTTIVKWETKAWGEIPADFGRK